MLKMRGASAALAVVAAAILVCCNAEPHADQDANAVDHNTGDRFDTNGHKTRNLDPLGGGNLIREVRDSRRPPWVPYLVARRFDYPGGKRELWPLISPMQYSAYYGDGLPKRNFDEIDRSSLDNFVRKRNFDEIDHTSMPFSYSKRFLHAYGANYIDFPESSFDKKRNRADYPMDEIDLSHFPIGSKRSFDNYPLVPRIL